MGSAGLVEALEYFQHGKRGQLSCARILAGENLPLAPKKRMCMAIALLLHRIGEEGKKVGQIRGQRVCQLASTQG